MPGEGGLIGLPDLPATASITAELHNKETRPGSRHQHSSPSLPRCIPSNTQTSWPAVVLFINISCGFVLESKIRSHFRGIEVHCTLPDLMIFVPGPLLSRAISFPVLFRAVWCRI